ncbi:phenylethanolamine N-methyltransferase-like [Chanos chanos]|uniref:Phenylethanolamine N-methyltransferase-like n=1 Tax=Chanos chanos TaxID=29144 RepID=A0A6J2W496_CHACN|nr:phenylethanolamine N-methyltransferase-like [Chanos chanos]
MEGQNGKESAGQEKRLSEAELKTCYQHFDPAAYLQYIYTPPRANFDNKDNIAPWQLGWLHRAFTEGDVKGDILVDIGSGPTLYQVMSGCERFRRVILSDFVEANCRELQNWLQGKSNSLDWTPFFQHVCKLEGRSPDAWSEKAQRLRSVVTDVLPIDVHQPHPLLPEALPPSGADCLISCYCLESASPDLASFNRALGHISSLLRQGGHLLLIGTLEMTFYYAAPELCIPAVRLDEAQLCSSLKNCGFQLLELSIYHLPQDMQKSTDDAKSMFFVKAKKQ